MNLTAVLFSGATVGPFNRPHEQQVRETPLPSDTTIDAEQVQMRLLREKSPAERLALAMRLSSEVIRASKRAISRAHPELTPRQVGHLFIELHYGRELADAVRRYEEQWDHGRPE